MGTRDPYNLQQPNLPGVGDPAHGDRDGTVFLGAVPKLTVVVVAPAVDPAASEQRTRVFEAGGDRGGVRDPARLCGALTAADRRSRIED
jgi:hypothetical protein